MSTPTPVSPAALVPSYGGLVLQLQKPLVPGMGRRFSLDPAVHGLPDPPPLFGRILCLSSGYYVAGPACELTEGTISTAALRGQVAQLNRRQPEAGRVRSCQSQAEALATLWALVVAHYQIADAAEQVARQRARDEASATPTA